MPDKQPSSFIPKSPVGAQSSTQKKRRSGQQGLGKFGVLGILVAVVAAALSVGVFFLHQTTTQNIAEKNSRLAEARRQIQSGEVNLLVTTDQKIENAKKILNNHVSMIDFFDLIGEYTVKSVSFNQMTLTGAPGQPYSLTISGRGNDIPSLIVQSNVLRDPSLQTSISGASLTSQGASDGTQEGESSGVSSQAGVNFTIGGTVNPNVFSFKKSLETSTVAPGSEVLSREDIEANDTNL